MPAESKSGTNSGTATGQGTAWSGQLTGPQMLDRVDDFVRDVVPRIQQDSEHFGPLLDKHGSYLTDLPTYAEQIKASCAGFPQQWTEPGVQAGATSAADGGGGQVYRR